MNMSISKPILSAYCDSQGTSFKEIPDYGGPSLVFVPHGAHWYLECEGAWYVVNQAGMGACLAEFFPLSIWDGAHPPAFVRPSGQVEAVSSTADALKLTLVHGNETRMMHYNATGGVWARWVVGAYDDDWLSDHAVVQYDGVGKVQFDFYLPEQSADTPTKKIEIRACGERLKEAEVARGGVTSVSLTLPADVGAGFLELVCAAPEEKARSGDDRDLGVVLAGLKLTAGAVDTSSRARRNLALMAGVIASATGQGTGNARHTVPVVTHFGADMPVGKKPRIAVVCWDLCHNPVGRALVLYQLLSDTADVELVGPRWAHCGGALWPPLAGLDLNIRSFPCRTSADFYPQAVALAASQTYDLVYICKPRLPGVLLGLLIKQASGCPVVLDIDDYELSFFDDPDSISSEGAAEMLPAAFDQLDGELATRLCDSLTAEFDAITVSNPALRKKYGGQLVRHARDGRLSDPSVTAARVARERLGIAPDVFAVFFLGTVRRHKGVVELARRLAAAPGPQRIELHIVAPEVSTKILADLKAVTGIRVCLHEPVTFAELPATLAAADCVALLQASGHAISRYQIPAKISDALALGVPVVVSDVAPVRDLIAQGAVTAIGEDNFTEVINMLMAASGDAAVAKKRRREIFDAEFGFDVNRARLRSALDTAAHGAAPLGGKLATLLDFAKEAYVKTQGGGVDALPRRSVQAAHKTPGPYDIVYFWKQNDSHLYGRRADMLPHYLLETGRVRKVLRFDLPMNVDKLHRQSLVAEDVDAQSFHIQRTTVNNLLHLNDRGGVRCRTFLYSDAPGKRFVAQDVPPVEDYVAFIRREMAAWQLDPARTLAMVSPVVPQFPALARELGFMHTLVDLIDDQRLFDVPANTLEDWEQVYRETLALADAVISNCTPLAEAFSGYAKQAIDVIPNGADTAQLLRNAGSDTPRLDGIGGPIAGYAGNLRDRVDWPLVLTVANALPDVSFVFLGGGLQEQTRQVFARVTNVHFPGVVPYGDLGAYLDRFSVAIMPHTKSEMTRNMNPLKLYHYLCHGLAVVSTDVENIELDLMDGISLAKSADEFVAMLRDILGQEKVRKACIPDHVSWTARAGLVVDKIDAVFAKQWPQR
ncbi:glycosyltransferase [Kordiimonas aestuarii]|uniref:glycosyltransferase n=1 Tax=Kordiimonas aestuarii TaxID=1005925 RepID=UPI0021D12C49|nr:glycosyltransferase [Kordiimonas aestuarii]